jgi:hypothetical protein
LVILVNIMIDNRIKKVIKNHWLQMVDDSYFYRGMALHDLNLKSKIILDPQKNPLKDITPILLEYSEFLLDLIKKGLEFDVNDFYIEPLQKVLNWTIRDLKNPGIDFTTNYADAVAYAFNYVGSQVKHNFNIITNNISKCKNQACFASAIEKNNFLQTTKRIRKLILSTSCADHKPIVLKVKRSCKAFQNDLSENLNSGNYQFFLKRVIREIAKNGGLMPDKAAFFLHQKSQTDNFNIRLIKPLYRKDVVEIIKF